MQTALTETDEKDKHPGGRPTLFNSRTLRKTREYLKNHDGDEIPTVAGLACVLGVSKQTVYRWVEQKIDNKFCDTIEQIATTQERKLINAGITGTYNAAMCKLLLAKHGYTEQGQGQAAINVNVSRNKVQISHKNQSLTIDQKD